MLDNPRAFLVKGYDVRLIDGTNVTKNQALAYMRQLCCLGLPKEMAVAEILKFIKNIIPSDNNVFADWNDMPYPCRYVIDCVDEKDFGVLLEEGDKLLTPQMAGNIARWHSRHLILDRLDIVSERFYQSDLYHQVCRPYGQHHILHAPVVSGLALGSAITLCRPANARGFSDSDKQLFKQLLPYISHAVQGEGGIDTEYANAGESGLLVMDCNGRLLFSSETARRYLSWLRYPAYPVGKDFTKVIEIPAEISQLCRNLDSVFRGRETRLPARIFVNPRGRFVFRAHWLEPANQGPGGLIGVTMEHQEPGVLRLLRGIRTLPLSPTQMDVCLLLAQNHSQENIARRLHISLTTAKDHIRKIYRKLDIHQREELLAKLKADVH